MKMFIQAKMDRPILPNHYITPGGFDFTINGKNVEFDFCESTGGKTFPLEDSGEKSMLYHAELRFLDIGSFPDSSVLCEENALSHIERINELFIYTGEKKDPVINVEKIIGVTFEEDGKTYSVSPDIIEDYNNRLHCEKCEYKSVF